MNFVDKKLLLSPNVAEIMHKHVDHIDQLVAQHGEPAVFHKSDGSPITPLDLALSAFFEELWAQHWPQYTFYSEEKFSSWAYPLLALDPLDGTREYINRRPEWAVSLGLLLGPDFSGEGWIYNPVTKSLYANPALRKFQVKKMYQGEISRTEWEQIPFDKSQPLYPLQPLGSIAYKLGRLAMGETDFVISFRPKNIWDIAAGTILCRQAGMKFYAEGQEVNLAQKLFRPPLIWCHPELFTELSQTYCGTGTSH